MSTIYVLDWYINKYIKIGEVDQKSMDSLNHWDMIVYRSQNMDGDSLSIGVYLWFDVDADRKWKFEKVLEWEDKTYFDQQQKYAKEMFPIFKKTFKDRFDWSKPVACRFHIYAHQLYCYFYSEDRYVFGDYVRILREKVWKNIFIFQVWARDMVRFSPVAGQYLTVDWRPLHASTNWPLPSVSMENIMLQNLDWRDVERLKWWSGKLKESVIYEAELYSQEHKRFPERGDWIEFNWIKWVCFSSNIMTWDVTIKTDDYNIMRVPVWQLKYVRWQKRELPPRKEIVDKPTRDVKRRSRK